jgi:hypothetical protein
MDNRKKTNLSELNQTETDPIDWSILDCFFDVDAPSILAQPLILTNVIKQNNILQVPEVDVNIVTNYLSGIVKDTQTLSARYHVMKAKYDHGKAQYVNNYNEDAHMFSLSISHDMADWLEQYEETVGQNFNNVIDYINSVAPGDNKINLT